MTRYLISDLHLDHANIIDYCDRPFTDVEEMNETLVENWNETVDDDDEVVFVGDLALTRGEDQLCEWIDRLSGRLVFFGEITIHSETMSKGSARTSGIFSHTASGDSSVHTGPRRYHGTGTAGLSMDTITTITRTGSPSSTPQPNG
jgi:hypothetical protein